MGFPISPYLRLEELSVDCLIFDNRLMTTRLNQPNVSHVFLEEYLIKQNVISYVDEPNHSLCIVVKDDAEVFHLDDVHSMEMCFFENGPLDRSEMKGAIVLRFNNPQSLFKDNVATSTAIALVVNGKIDNYSLFEAWVDRYARLFASKSIVQVVAFPRFPDFLKEDLVNVQHINSNRLRSRIRREKSRIDYQDPTLSIASRFHATPSIISLSSDSEDEAPVSYAPYYLIDGNRMQISEDGINSLMEGSFLNDEIINISLGRMQGHFPQVHAFDTLTTEKIVTVFQNKDFDVNCKMSYSDFNRHFGWMFMKNRDEPCDVTETFFSKKMLIFPINHEKHWLLVVVVNPLLADYMTSVDGHREPSEKPIAYYIDSLKGWNEYTDEMLQLRLSITWNSVYAFLRLAAFHHAYSYLGPITCEHNNNLPSQKNKSDCGSHCIENARLVSEMYEDLLKAPTPLTIPEEKIVEVEERVSEFRSDMSHFLAACKM